MAETKNQAKDPENRAPPGRFEHPAVDLEVHCHQIARAAFASNNGELP